MKQTTLVLTGDGANASLLPFVNESGELEEVIIENRGSGYTFLDIEVVGDGLNANCFAQLSTGDLDTDFELYQVNVDEMSEDENSF